MACLGADMITAEETTVISTEANCLAIQKPDYHFKSLENRDLVYEKLGQQELEITQKLQTLKLNQAKIREKRKSSSSYGHGYYPTSTNQDIAWRLRHLWELKQSLSEPTNSIKPGQRKNSHISSPEEILLNQQLAKLHKGRLHGSINFVKERELLKKLEQARGEKEKICSDNVPTKQVPQIFSYPYNYKRLMNTSRGYTSHYSEEAITYCIKVLSSQVEELRMKKMGYEAYSNHLNLEQMAIEKEIKISERKLENIKQKVVRLASKSQAR